MQAQDVKPRNKKEKENQTKHTLPLPTMLAWKFFLTSFQLRSGFFLIPD